MSGLILGEIIRLVNGEISKSKLIGFFDQSSPFFNLKAKIRVNSRSSSWAPLWHFTTGGNCCNMDNRIPAIIASGTRVRIHALNTFIC